VQTYKYSIHNAQVLHLVSPHSHSKRQSLIDLLKPTKYNMQLIKLATFTALIMTVSAAVPGVVHLRDDIDNDVELFERESCSNIAKIKRPNKYEKEGYAIPLFDSQVTGFLICYR